MNTTTDFEDMNFVVKQLESFVRLLSGESLFAQQADKEADVLVKWSHRVDIRKYRYYFRGEPSCDYKLLPKISRQECNLFDRENIIRREMMRAFPNVFRSGVSSPIEQLIVMQHYGVPTRLLDVTTNFLVALYFACQATFNGNTTDADGRVMLFEASTLTPSEVINKGKVFRELEYHNPFVNHMVGEIRDNAGRVPLRETSVISRGRPEDIAEWCHPLILRSAYFSERQRVQSGHFLFFPNKYVNNNLTRELCEEPTPSETLTIKGKFKGIILEWLDLFFGINKMNLFPEDIDGGCRDILEPIKKGVLV